MLLRLIVKLMRFICNFNMNKNLEYFSTPDAYKTKYKHLKNKRNITINLKLLIQN